MEKPPTPRTPEFEPKIVIEGEVFSLFREQRHGNAVYKSERGFLRIGDSERIGVEKNIHDAMAAQGMPLPKILSEGTYKNKTYYIEESAGEKHFGELFHEHYSIETGVDQELFEQFMGIVKQYFEAQLTTIAGPVSKEEVAGSIGLETLCQKYPDQAEEMRNHFEKVIESISVYPSALTQGDFNPFNILPGGVIDLEFAYYGPLPYDAATVISHHDNFQPFEGNEFKRNYAFSETQKQAYLAMIDNLYATHDLPPLSSHMKEFDFLRTVRTAASVSKEKNPNAHVHIYNRLTELMQK